MRRLKDLFEKNQAWAQSQVNQNPQFFDELAAGQEPSYLWIGCADSRVPPNEIVGLPPGELFVHRNIANLVVHSDMSCLSVLEYAVEVLKVRHVIVCGHYGCGGVAAAMGSASYGIMDNWLRHIKDVYLRHREELEAIADEEARRDRFVELNVQAQLANVCYTSTVQRAWSQGQPVAVHGWVYGLEDGLLKDLNLCIESKDQIPGVYRFD